MAKQAESHQEALDFGRLYRVADGARAVYRQLGDAVDAAGILVAAGACGIDRGDLRRSLDRDGRRVAVEHALAIAAISGPDMCRGIAQAFVAPLGLKVVDETPLTDREFRARAEAAMQRHGVLGAALMDEITGGRR